VLKWRTLKCTSSPESPLFQFKGLLLSCSVTSKLARFPQPVARGLNGLES